MCVCLRLDIYYQYTEDFKNMILKYILSTTFIKIHAITAENIEWRGIGLALKIL